MIVIVEDSRGWYFNGFNKQGSEVECSEAVYSSAKESVKLSVKETEPKKTKNENV